MNKEIYKNLENYMLESMKDSCHDCQHIYRVLYSALDIANAETNVDMDVLIASCLLHDIGRAKQAEDPSLCHAEVGSYMAYWHLVKNDWDAEKAEHIMECISSHRFRGDNAPKTIEAKILYDADKLDSTGALGIARTLVYEGQIFEPLYIYEKDNIVIEGGGKEPSSFFQEYNYKLIKLYNKFYTNRGKEMAEERKKIAEDFYRSLYEEVANSHKIGIGFLGEYLNEKN